MYNSLTPNGNDQNDIMEIKGLENATSYSITIYNRWGVKVFTSTNYEENPFRGLSNGRATVNENEALPSGTYYYVLEYEADGVTQTQIDYLYIH